MPAWTPREDREYQHIKKQYQDRGQSADRAEEIAARTVNKQRRKAGETPTRRTHGTGNPRTSLDARTRDELQNLAREAGIRGRGGMRKAELVSALREKRGQ